MVYIREAHPSDGWQVPANRAKGIEITDPKSEKERAEVAAKACSLLKIKLPCLVDGMDDVANKAYGAWPDRIYVVDKEGKIAVMGGQGPGGFAPSVKEMERWLNTLAAAAAK